MLSSKNICEFHERSNRLFLHSLYEQTDGSVAGVLNLLREQNRSHVTFSLPRAAFDVAQRAVMAGLDKDDSTTLNFGIQIAENTAREYLQPQGTFFEYDRASWLEPEDLWRTIPWGTAFRGNEMLDVFVRVRWHLEPESNDWWLDALTRMAHWIHGNPVVGTFVFNCAIDLCRLLWRIGNALQNESWMRWALDAGHERIQRDVDVEGFIQGENGGCSGVYQLVGAEKLGLFAWQSQDRELIAAMGRVFGSLVMVAPPSLVCPGNYGTRSSALKRVPPEAILTMSALGDATAAGWLRDHGTPDWSRDYDLWQAALQKLETAPRETSAPPAVISLDGIQSTVVRHGPFMAYFCNYNRSLWARGFCNLWHAGLNDFLFATLHSLDTRVEKSKLLLGDTSDWSGFPHVKLHNGENTFHSQQQIENLEAVEESNGVVVRWQEYLNHSASGRGALLHSTYHFQGEQIFMRLELERIPHERMPLSNNAEYELDFHLLCRPQSFIGLWHGEAVAELQSGVLPTHGGWHHNHEYSAGEPKLAAVQIDNSLFAIEVRSAPPEYSLSLGYLQNSGLHTGNFGGVRLRLKGSAQSSPQVFEVSLQQITPKEK